MRLDRQTDVGPAQSPGNAAPLSRTQPSDNPPTMSRPAIAFQPLPGVFEPSAIQQLPDGRLLVVEDEKEHPFTLLTIAGGEISTAALCPGLIEFDDAFWKLDDLEGLALDAAGRVCAITSHSRNSKGETKNAREKLVRFRVQGDDIVERQVVGDLKTALVAVHPLLAAAAGVRDVKNEGGLNIEALEFDPHTGALWTGFRSPVPEGRAILARLENPDEMFDAGAPPRIAGELVRLDLRGDGLRGMAWVPALAGYLLISGPVAREQVPFRLWLWNGESAAAPRQVTVPGLAGFAHAEGVCPARLAGRDVIVLVSDDGDRAAGRCAHHLILEPGELRIEP